MSSRDTDFEFDFFEEPETQEAPGRSDRPRRGPRMPRGPMRPRAGFTPLLRLLGLIAFAILIVVLLLLWVQSCQEDKKHDAYSEYMTSMSAVARDSERVGRELSDALTTPGIKPAELQKQLTGLAQQQEIGVDRARKLDPPGPLLDAHERAVEALVFRADGLAGLAEAFRRTQGSKDAAAAGALLASQAERFVASDVVWDDLFKEPSVIVLRNEEISGVEVPDSNFIQTPDLASTRSMVPIWERINGSAASGSTGGTPSGLHGTNIESVKVIPGGQTLSESTENTVEASTDLGFAVAVAQRRRQPGSEDRGDADDPAEPDPDREEADDRHHQPGRDEDGGLPGLPVGRLRRAADHADRRRPGAGRVEDRQQLRRVPDHLLAGGVAA